MFRIRFLLILAVFILTQCGASLKEGYDSEIDQDWEILESMTYLQEGGNILGGGESIEGLLKYFNKKPLDPVNYDLVPEDSNIRILEEERYDLRRLKRIEVEIRFPEVTKVEKMLIYEDYEYKTPGGDSEGDLNDTKPVSEGGPFAAVTVDYTQIVEFEKFSARVQGKRIYYQDTSVSDFIFYDTTTGNRGSISRILTQGSYTGGVGNFTRIAYFKNGQIASDVKSYNKDESGKITGTLSGNSIDGIVVEGTFEIDTANTPCVLDDTGTYDQIIYYPVSHESGRKMESASFTLDLNGAYDGSFTLEKIDGSVLNKELNKVVTRPSSCDKSVIRNTSSITGTNYAGDAIELSETVARKLSHVTGVVNAIDGGQTKIDIYRVSGISVYR